MRACAQLALPKSGRHTKNLDKPVPRRNDPFRLCGAGGFPRTGIEVAMESEF